ncbi:hypothetical protein M5689_019282 [Euphorbia peplus]|nr:hypothetical protein M5689_019282 [Euphorbia peplus]
MDDIESNPSEDPNLSVSSKQNHENEIELSAVQVIIVPINEELSSLQERTKKSPKLLKSKAANKSCTIFRVPQNILDLHPRSFQPGIVSIGPYYHGEQGLQMMEDTNTEFLEFFLIKFRNSMSFLMTSSKP